MITVNPSTRHFNIPGSDLVFGVTDDANAETKEFQCPRYVGNNLDLMGCFIRINYRNANGEIDSYLVPELTLDGDNIRFGWELTPKVTMYKGNISFVLCAVGPDTKVKWHTTLGRGQVLEGLEPDGAMIELGTADVVAQLIALVEAQAAAVEKAGADQVIVVKDAAKAAQDSAVAEIEAKRKNSLESIPADYTSLEDTVDGLVRSRAGAIVCEVSGSAVAVNDASDNYICGLRIFGRSTQDGTPAPDAPVEIVSVESPKVTVAGKNLLPYPYTQTSKVESGVTFVDNGDGSITANGTAAVTIGFWFIGRQEHIVLPAGSYVLCPFDVPTGTHIDVAVSDDDLTWYGVASATNAPSTFNLSRNVYISVRWYVPEKAVLSNATMRAMLCKAGVNLEYEHPDAHRKLLLTHSIRGIPVTSGGNYTDENGKQWICDEVDLERGVYVQRTAMKIFNGTETAWRMLPQAFAFVITWSGTAGGWQLHHTIASHFVCSTEAYNGTPGYFTIDQNGLSYFATGHKTLDEFKEWLVNNPVTVVCRLATPIETPLSETELAAYRALRSNYPNTTILNDAGAHMAVKYAADTKLYIDNKIAALISG